MSDLRSHVPHLRTWLRCPRRLPGKPMDLLGSFAVTTQPVGFERMPHSVCSDHGDPPDVRVHARHSKATFVFESDEASIAPASAPRVLDQPDAGALGHVPFPLAAPVEAAIGVNDEIEVELIDGLDRAIVGAEVLAAALDGLVIVKVEGLRFPAHPAVVVWDALRTLILRPGDPFADQALLPDGVAWLVAYDHDGMVPVGRTIIG